MKGLLLKEFYTICKYCWFTAVLIGVFLIVSCFGDGNLFFAVYPCFLAGMLPITLLSYDERDKWHIFAQALPCTRAQIVSAKYIAGLCCIVLTLFLTAVAQAFRMSNTHSFLWMSYGTLLITIFAASLIPVSIALPFVFRFGAEKGRVLFIAIIAIACGGVSVFMEITPAHFTQGGSTLPAMALICACSILLYALSWLLSILLYKRRQLR